MWKMGSAERSGVRFCARWSGCRYWLSFMSGIISVKKKKKKVDFHAHANRITEVPFWLIFSGFCEKILSSQAVLRG